MDSTDQQVVNAVRDWDGVGQRFALVTVARTWGSAPRQPGSWMALREDGCVQGSVSGGCIEDDLIRQVLDGGFESNRPFRLEYGVTQDQARRRGLPCGGTMELVVEPCPDGATLRRLSECIAEGVLVRRSVTLGEGGAVLSYAEVGESVSWDGSTLTTVHGPARRLLMVGAGQIARYLAPIAQGLGYQVFICDPRREYTTGWDVTGTTLLNDMPDDAAAHLVLDSRTAVVALTHDRKLDDLALLEALRSTAFYVGALGSRTTNRTRREQLLEHFDLSREEVDRLRGPVGLSLGGRTPPEIAVAIAAEMVAAQNGVAAEALECPST